jgi:hypothetical protein
MDDELLGQLSSRLTYVSFADGDVLYRRGQARERGSRRACCKGSGSTQLSLD